ncbi:MAG: T9SS type A sorting domain-containing protein [Bacteroidales bacterium]|jgi:hypothetical protein|nr:T9SS type A sorting domain-containing protein [Bacteroidales bacterium]
MKKLIALLIVFCAYSSYSQSFSVSYDGYTFENNDTVNFVLPLSSPNAFYYFDIANNSATDIPLKIRKEIITLAQDADFQYCFNFECTSGEYSAESYLMPAGFVLDTLSDEDHAFHLQYNNGVGTTKAKITFFNEDDPTDNTVLYVTISNEPLSVAQVFTVKKINAYPNPANQQVTIAYELPIQEVHNLSFSLINFVGQTVTRLSLLNNSGEVKLDLSGLSNGIYFYTFENNKQKIVSQKLIIQH